jgi:hypothetical protein
LLFEQDGDGFVFVVVGIDFGGEGVVGGNLEMVKLSFTKRGECSACQLCLGQNNPFRSKLTNADGQAVTIEGKCSKEITSNGTITVDAPETSLVNVACDGNTADVVWDTPTAADTCELIGFSCDGEYQNPFTNQVIPVSEIGIDPLTGGTFPIGVTNFCCTAENVCGDVQTDCWTVDVSDKTTLDVELELSPTMNTKVGEDIARCITFELFSNCVQAPEVVEVDVVFGGLFNLTGHFASDIKLPAVGQYSCITAQDQLHSLRSCYVFEGGENGDCDEAGVLHASFKGDPDHFGGNWLIQGNLDAWKKDNPDASHDSIDITDFGTFVSQYLQELSPNTDCDTSGPHSDINGDGIVDLLDFTFISMNFLEDSKDCCCPSATAAGVRGRTSVSVAELRRTGQGDLAVADLNADGMVDLTDVALAMRGEIPTGRKLPKRDRTGSGLR